MQGLIIFALLVVTSPVVLALGVLGMVIEIFAVPLAKLSIPVYKLVPNYVDPRVRRRLKVKKAKSKGTGLKKIRAVSQGEIFEWRIWFCYMGWIRKMLRNTYKKHRSGKTRKRRWDDYDHNTTGSNRDFS